MPKALSYDQQADAVRSLRKLPAPSADQLTPLLVTKYNDVAAEVCKLIAQHKVIAAVPALVAAFGRFMIKADTTDRGCLAKSAIVQALNTLEEADVPLLLTGVRHVQMEASFGGSVDTAGELRGHSLLGLVRAHHSDALTLTAELLTDPATPARSAAIRALEVIDPRVATALLILKANMGDAEPDILSEVFIALLAADEANLPFVTRFLSHALPTTVEAAALALGSSRLADAFMPLRDHLSYQRLAQVRRTFLLALALLRHPPAVDYLIGLLAKSPESDSIAAIEALAIYKHDEAVRQRVADAVKVRKVAAMAVAFERWKLG